MENVKAEERRTGHAMSCKDRIAILIIEGHSSREHKSVIRRGSDSRLKPSVEQWMWMLMCV